MDLWHNQEKFEQFISAEAKIIRIRSGEIYIVVTEDIDGINISYERTNVTIDNKGSVILITKKEMKNIIISVDFDGTMCTHKFPNIGKEAPHCSEVLKEFQEKYGIKIVLNTMRNHYSGINPLTGELTDITENTPGIKSVLQDAVDWCDLRGIILYGINDNPSQNSWTNSRKIYADMYIDDMSCGAPMRIGFDGEPVIDWIEVKRIILEKFNLE